MNHRNHPWHLVRCPACRTFVISSAPKCPGCGAWRPSARAVSVAAPLVAGALGIVALVFLTERAIQLERLRAEKLAELTQNVAKIPR